MKIKLGLILLGFFLFLLKNDALANDSTDNNIHLQFKLTAFNEIDITGIARLEIQNDLDSAQSVVEIIGKATQVHQIRLGMKQENKSVLNVYALGIEYQNALPKNIPIISIHLPKNQNHLTLSSNATLKVPTKIYIKQIALDSFQYKGSGDSLLVISSLKVEQALFKTQKIKGKGQNTISADMEIKNIQANDLSFQLEGSSNIELQGKSKTVEFHTLKSAKASAVDVFAEGLTVDNCKVDIRYDTSIKISVMNLLTGKALDKSTIIYGGDPQVQVHTSKDAYIKKVEY